MQIFIPSRSRFDRKSLTIERIEGGWEGKHEAFLVVPVSQVKSYKAMPGRGNIAVLGCSAEGIARTREWIGKRADDKFIMLDDDLRFFYRPTVRPLDDPLPGAGMPNDKPPRLYRAKAEHIAATFACIEHALDSYVHAAISAREGNNTQPFPYAECRRPLRALAYRKWAFLSVEHGRVPVMEDFDVTLQLLAKGHKNFVTTEFAQDQYATALPGGCADYRSHAIQEAAVKKMAELHRPFVVTRWKDNKHGGTFGKRMEATIYWSACYKEAMKELGL